MASPQKLHHTPHVPRGHTFPSQGKGIFRSCLLTWYDPALGGVNSSHGQRDPHAATASGEPYDPHAMTCAAPPAYSFGTHIEFVRGGTSVVCKVNDRGGAIQGHHFDLARAPAELLGVIKAGKATGKFRITSAPAGSATTNAGTPGVIGDPLSTAVNAATGSGNISLPNPLDGLKLIAAWFKLAMSLFYPGTWVRIGKAIIGFFLIMWGVHSLLKSQGIDVVKGAKRAAVKTAEAAAIVK